MGTALASLPGAVPRRVGHAAGDEELTIAGGHLVVVPAATPHAFKGAGADTLRVISVQPSGTVVQTRL
jgi:hypothetical protein